MHFNSHTMNAMNDMTESFLHYVWQHHQYDVIGLQTTNGEQLKVIFPGYHNHDAGPDFKQAILQIDNLKWAGDVEIHIHSSDWYKHKHQEDEKYLSVALHVVYVKDCEVFRNGVEAIPTLELKDRISDEIFHRYHSLVNSMELIPCQYYLQNINSLCFTSLSSSMAMERLLQKQTLIMETVHQCHEDWNEAIYRQLAISFGFHTNAVPFELLSRSLSYKVLSKHSDSCLQIAALVFGQAGMLRAPAMDEYYNQLKYEYDFLQYKYDLVPISDHHWNLLRLRPQNFPCLRLAQFCEVIFRIPNLFQEFVRDQSADYWYSMLSVSPNAYWQTHYHFGQKTDKHPVTLGQTAITLLLINTIMPFLFAYNHFSGNEYLQERAFALLEQLPFENNKITRIYRHTPFLQNNSLDSQALIHLERNYCETRLCLECPIGGKIIGGQ